MVVKSNSRIKALTTVPLDICCGQCRNKSEKFHSWKQFKSTWHQPPFIGFGKIAITDDDDDVPFFASRMNT